MLQIEQFNLSGDLIKGNLILVGNITHSLYLIYLIYIIYFPSIKYCYPFPLGFSITFSIYLVVGEFLFRQIPPLTATR